MKALLATLLLIAVATASYNELEATQIFQTWKINNQKVYSSEEVEQYRFQVFQQNLELIDQLSAEQPEAKFAANKFADLTQAEFKAIYLNLVPKTSQNAQVAKTTKGVRSYPTELDWTTKGAVTAIKDQGDCGACWAFSAVATIESKYFITGRGALTSFSEQELVDCDTLDDGCNGGLMDNAFTWLTTKAGLMTESDYPYTAVQGTCQSDPTKYVIWVLSYEDLAKEDENAMLDNIQNAPLATGIHADSLQFYAGGIFNPLACSHDIDHGVTTVGYGVDSKKDFWKVKNSWGSDWGESGFFRIIRGKDKCGVADQVSIVNLK